MSGTLIARRNADGVERRDRGNLVDTEHGLLAFKRRHAIPLAMRWRELPPGRPICGRAYISSTPPAAT
jgi:hypothetical protein